MLLVRFVNRGGRLLIAPSCVLRRHGNRLLKMDAVTKKKMALHIDKFQPFGRTNMRAAWGEPEPDYTLLRGCVLSQCARPLPLSCFI